MNNMAVNADLPRALDPRQILQPRILEGIMNKKIEQNLDFGDMFPVVQTDALSFAYFEDLQTAGSDIQGGIQAMPSPLMEIGELDEIETSSISMKYGGMQRFGYQLKFSKRMLREQAVIDEISRAVDRAAFGISKKMNDDIIAAFQAGAKGGQAGTGSLGSGATTWDSASATPVEDMLTFTDKSMVEGYPYALSDLYVHQTNYFEALKYVQGVDINWVQDPFGGLKDLPEINGVRLHNIRQTQLNEGGYMGADSRYPGLTIYEHVDSDINKSGHVNINVIHEEKYPYNTVVEFYAERGIAPKLPMSLYYSATGI
jgi:hypothetical protein